MGSKDCRRPGGEPCISDICITCEHLVSRERLRVQHEGVPIAGRLLGSLVFEVFCTELHNCRPSHRLFDSNIPLSVVNL
ncbi:hypothetical protein HOY82DRAFT_479317 [Tuber indicum]|nr:hypothetical protein HOY82DRAFT_479317 [Tuber indicum]